MTRRMLLASALRVAGLVCLIYAVWYPATLLAAAADGARRETDASAAAQALVDAFAPAGTAAAVFLISGMVILWNAGRLARRLGGGGEGAESSAADAERRLLRLGMRVVGVVFLLRGLAMAARTEPDWWLLLGSARSQDASALNYTCVGAGGAVAAVALYLLIGGLGVVRRALPDHRESDHDHA